MKIRITGDDIRDGLAQSGTRCPIALALMRELSDDSLRIHVSAYSIRVTRYEPYVLESVERKYAQLTAVAERFVRAFDRGRKVRPHTFEIRFDDD